MKRVFVTDYVGLSTRLEALALAFMISDYFGHEVCIDWNELDALHVPGANIRGRGLLGRLDSLKLHGDASSDLHRAADHRNVNVRTHHGPRHLLEKYYLPTARRVKLRPDLIEMIRGTFARYSDRPLVGVHIRRGDFLMASDTEFDVNALQWPAVPNWWYEHVMAQIQQAVPDVAFFVSCTGSLDQFPLLQARFEMFDMPAASPYKYTHHRKAGHLSHRHPAVDLFALGCCTTLIGTPCSTFTHYAANMLGAPTTVLIPPAHKIQADAPEYGRVELHGRGAADWYATCRTGRGQVAVSDAATLSIAHGAFVEWM
ncbi:MAG TPA: hypothetical protein VNU48_06610 [Burkholderiaceae bacterium]|nr:hypothetical protein [Burkholderiaceae bacterium]